MGASGSHGLLGVAEIEAQRVKIDEKKDLHSFLPFGCYVFNIKSLLKPFVLNNRKLLINFHARFRL